jgi:hypothetical protein
MLSETKFSPSYRGRSGTWCRECFAAHMRGERVSGQAPSQTCAYCGTEYIPKRTEVTRTNTHCSRACKDRARKDRLIAEREAAKAVRLCVWCHAKIPQRMRVDARFCSAQCNSAAHQLTRRSYRRTGETREETDLVLRTTLAERDGLVCYLCDIVLSLATRHPDPLFASVDHVVPVAKAGTNDLPNLRLAHLICNLRKRAELLPASDAPDPSVPTAGGGVT